MQKSRYRRTIRFFTGVMLREMAWELLFPRIGLGALSRRTRAARMRRIASRFRILATRMGGVLIKVGQFLSSRLDVLPREITAELAGLQDEVGADSFKAIRGVIEAEFGVPIEAKFAVFDPEPVASASIGQVYRARLCVPDHAPDGRGVPGSDPCPPVVVKVQRPRIREIVDADLAAIRVAGRWLQRLSSVRRHVNVPGLIDEFSRTLYEEIDYLHEGRSAEKFAQSFRSSPEVVVPGVIWSHTTARVLTLQDVGAIKITDYAAIQAAGISRREVAQMLLDVYLKQVFEDGFFHADPHPGNLFVLHAPTRGKPGAWKLVFVDFGMTGTLSPDSFAGLREVLLAVGTRDAARLLRAFQSLHVLLPGADLDLLERACKRVFDTLWGKTTAEMMRMSSGEFQSFADEFGDLLYEMPFQVPEDFILLGRCVSILSGMATGLDPDFNVWGGLAPYVQRLVEKDGSTGVRMVIREVGNFARVLLGLPRRAEDIAARIEQGRLDVRVPDMKQYVARLERSSRKLAGAIVFAAGLVAGTNLYLAGHMEIALGFGVAEVLLLGWILLAR
jgi:predicted unusual protein kinase regulating ubiquinone biosynthesis (AarF/ABC1/UbiB family)